MENVLILGNPNSGKTLLFNRLTGLKQKVANFPGVTVEILSAEADGLIFQDFPGTYSLKALTIDEKVAIEGFTKAITDPQTRAIICVLDATRLERSLYLLLQLIEVSKKYNCPVIAAVNVIDEIITKNIKMDLEGLSNAINCPVIGISAKKRKGLKELKNLCLSLDKRKISSDLKLKNLELNSLNTKEEILKLKAQAHELSKKFGPQNDVLLKSQHRLDDFFLSSWAGALVFAALMLFLFQSIFTWAAPFMEGINDFLDVSGQWVATHVSNEILSDFIKDALFAGLGSFLVFAPQIFILFIVIGLLEDSGYLARAAVILHKPLSLFGLSGRSFVTMLSGHACAIPAIMSARTIESPRKRLLTIIATPFMSCSARLPVYAMLVGGFVPATTILWGTVGLQGFAFFMLFAIGIVMGLIVSAILDKTLSKKTAQLGDAPFVIELPPYRMPNWRPIVMHALNRTFGFVQNAGFMIFSVTVVIWFLGYFPDHAGHLDTSWLGRIGKWIEPLFTPMGMDWKVGVAVLTSFLAREVFVGTLGTLYGIDSVEGDTSSLAQKLQASGVTLASALALAVFYSLAMQCVSTLAVMKKETGSAKIPVYVFIGMTVIAYAAAAVVFVTVKSLTH